MLDKLKDFTARNASKLVKHSTTLIIGLILITAITLGNISRDLIKSTEDFKRIETTLHDVNRQYRRAIILEGYRNAEVHSKILRDKISDEIDRYYQGDKSKIRKDLDRYASSTDVNHPIYKIFADTAYEYQDQWFEKHKDIRIVIANRDHIMFSTEPQENLRKRKDIPNIIFDYKKTNILSINPENRVITENTVDELSEEDVQLRKVRFIAPSYIYEHEDILGVRDFYPSGKSTNNYKLAVMFIYRPVDDVSITMLDNIKSNIKYISEHQYADIISRGIMDLAFIFGASLLCCIVWYFGTNTKQ